MKSPLYVIGSSNTDMVVKSERLPGPGETILGGTFLMNAGGKGANQAVAAARLGGQVFFVACVGNDVFGHTSLDQFKKENLDTRFVIMDHELPSGVALINVDAMGENCIAVAPGSNLRLLPQSLHHLFTQLQAPAHVLIQLEIPLITVEYVVRECQAREVPVILNPAPATHLPPAIFSSLYAITPNETEARMLTGCSIQDDAGVQQAANGLLEKGVRNVIITLGKRGAYWSTGSASGFVTAPMVIAVDSTAAGDCFSGALTVALAEGMALPDAVQFACGAASVSVTRMGAQASMPYRNEIR